MAKSYSSIKPLKGGKTFEDENKPKKSYKDIKASDYDFGVDDKYIKSYFEDVAKYSSEAEKDYNGITYGSDVSGLYDKHFSQTSSLRERGATIRAYLNSRKSSIDEDTYNEFIKTLDSHDTFTADTSKAFKQRKDFYTTFKTQYDYDAYVLNNTGDMDSNSISARKSAYDSITARLAEIDKELTGYTGISFIDNILSDYDTSGHQELIKERDKLKVELTKYDNDKKATDELYTQYSGNEDWGEDSQNRDFNRPRGIDIAQYGTLNIDTGEMYDIDESVVTMEDPLGTYFAFRNGEDGYEWGAVPRPSFDPETEKDTRASQHVDAYNLALEKGREQHWENLSDEEIKLYYYMLSNGLKDQALSYLDGMEIELDRRASVEYQKELEEASALELVFHNVVSIPANIIGGTTAFVDDVINTVMGNDINPYEGGHAMQNYAQGVRTATANDINKATGASEDDWLTWGDAYQGLMSAADSVAGAAVFGSGYTVLMGMGGAASEAKELYEAGASKGQIIAGSLLAGAAEAAFEKISIGYFLDDVLGKPAKHIGQWLYKTLGMAGVEATEEFCTTIANYISDATVRGGASDWAALIEGYTNEGYSNGEAIWRAIKEVGGEALHDGVIGAISGGGMGAIGNTVSALQYDSAAKSYGKQIIDAGGVDTLKSLALDMAGEQKGIANFANKLALKQYANEASKADLTTKKGAKSVGVLADTVDTVKSKLNKGDIKSALIAKGLSKDKAENYANILVAMNEEYFNGNDSSFTLGTDEQWKKMTGDKNAYSVLSEIVTDKNSAVNIRNLAVGNAKRGIRVDSEGKLDETDVAAYQERQTTKMIQAIAEANGLQQDVETDLDVSDDGKVYADTDNGTVEVTSKEFVDSEDGTLKVKVNGDQEVDTSSVSYGNVGEALVVSAIVDMGIGAEDANALYNMFKGVDEKAGQAYAKGISLAFKYGRYFYSPSKLSGIVGISKEQAKEAFRIGRESRSKDTKASQAQLNATAEENAKEGKKVSSKGSVVYEGTIADENGNLAAGDGSLTDIQKASVNGLKLIAELSPLNFHLFQSEKDGDTYTYVKKNGEETHANGWYRVGTNDIYIDLNAGITGEGTVMYTAAHEISHFIKQYSPEKWDKIAEYIMNEYCAHYGGKVDALLLKHITAIKARPDANTKTQKEIEDEAFEDLVCDSLSRMLIDGTVVEAMANIKKKDKGVWNAIKNAVLKLLDKWGVVIDQYKDRNPDAEEAGYFRETSKAFKKLQGMLTEAFVDASDTYSKVGNLKAEQSEVLSDRATAEESKAIKSLGKGASVERNENGDMLVATNKDGSTVMYSERTWRMGGKEKFIATMKSLGHGEQAQEYAKYLDDALGYLHELAVGYEILGQHLDADIVTDIKNGKQVLSAIVNNGEYPVNIDLALICKKRVAYMRLMAKMIEDGVFGDVKYDGDAIAEVNKILRKNGFETACLGCFVESRRLQFQTWAETIVQEWNEAVEARNKYAHYFRFADGKASLTDEEIEALDKELASGGKKNDKGNLNLGQGSVSAKMSRLLDKVPSLARKLTVDDLLTPQGLTALRATDSNLFSLVKQRYGAASPKIVQDYNPYASEIADLTFNFVKKVTGNNVKGAQDYIKQAKKELGDAPKKLKSESKEDFSKRKAEYDTKVEALAMQKYLYSIGGARIQSFSDFMIENVFDYLQIFADLAAKELPMHGYTKEVVALRLFGMSGAKWNGSLIAHVEKSMGKEYAGLLPASEAKNGNGILVKVDGKDYCIAFDDYARNKATNGESFIQSIGMKDIVALMYDPRYSPYVGNITIGVSDKQIMAMLDSPLFRMVIPYHASGMLPQFAQLVGVDMYNDYTNYQNTTVREIRLLNDTDYTVKIGDNGKPKVVKKADGKDVSINTHYAFNEKLQKYGDARKTCQDYLAWCKNEHPIYDKGKVIGFATFNAKFSDSPTGVDFTKHRNYYKLIEDFNTYDNITEKASQQGAVTMNFPSAENRLSADQKSAYEKALRDTGIFTEADIKKYLKKADMTFEEIVREEVGNRKAYNDAQEPKFDSTVKEVEDYLLNAKDDKGNYKFRRDSVADTASDYIEAKNHGISLKPATGSYMDEVKNSDRKSLAKKGRTPYNEFASVAMQWANSNTTKVGDAKIIYDGRRDKHVLIEASVDGYIENASGNYERVRSLYEQAHRGADNDIYADLDQARTRRGRGVWDLQPAEDGGYDVRDVRSSGSKGLQTDSARDDEHLRRGNQRESVKESSRRDSSGRKLTEAQQEYFKDSKVRDADGNLMPVYHGTPTGGFTIFEMPHYLSTLMSAEGAGFYFTDKKNAKQYMKPRNGKLDSNRQLYEVYLNITNPMEIEPYSTGHITDQQMRDIFARGNYQWGMEHTDVEKEIRINKWDSDRLASLVRVFNGDAVLDAMKDVLGYDGVRYTDQYGDIWVAWEQSQIKSTTNTNPTKDPDIRYQDRNSNSLSSRALLANALESTIDTSTQEGQNELKKLKEYKEMIGTLDELSYKLTNLRKALFSPGITGEERKKVQEEATKTANRISVCDKKLLTLEASKPLKKLLDREKALAVKRQKAIDAENMAAYKKESEAKLKRQAEYYQESREKAVERVKETRAKNEAKAKLQKLVLDTAKWISYPKKGDVKCPDILRAPYADFLKGIDFSSKTLLEKGEQTKNDMRMIMAMDSLATAVERIQTAQNPETENAEALDIGYLDLPPNFVKMLREMAEKVKGMMINGDYVINQMTSVDIKQLTRLIRTLNHSIKEMSTLYSNLRFARVEELGDNSISFMEEIGEVDSTSGVGDFFAWDNALPYYAFKRFGKAGESLFEELMDAQDKLAFLADEIIKFREKAWNDAEAKSWSEDTHTIELPSGKEIILTTADAMSIYCLYRRDNNQGLNHLVGGGVRVIGANDGAKQAKDSKVELDIDDVLAICDTLDDRPKAVAEAIQEYMSTVCSEWGNEISMKRFLTKDFVEKRYFPIQSNDEALAVRDPQAQQSDLYRLLNISATKPLTPNANNSVIIRNIFDVFTEHTSDMARLNAYGMALLDYMKWVNYNEKTKNEKGQINIRGVRSAMNNAYGQKAQSYIIGLVKDINGRFNDGGDHPFLMKMTRYAKTASVGANIRVAALQFTAYPRASMVLSTANLAKGLSKKPQISKARKYCGVALWKSFGFYDTNIARSIEDQIKGTTNWRQKLIELSLKPAEWGDSITWGFLWNACEYDVANSNKQLKVGSEEFNQAVAKRLREVIYSTQVVDSVLTRSQIMRNKSGLTQTATAFMSEPTLTSNITMDAGFQFYLEKRRTGSAKAAWAKTGKHITKTATVFGATSVIIAIAESLADAFRDDDEEEFIAKFGEAMLENSVSNLLIFNKIPIVADVMEGLLSLIGLGYFSTDRLDTVWLADIVKAGETWIKVLGEAFGTKNTSVTVYKALYDTAKAFSSSTGIPVSGLLRELVTLWNNTAGAANPDLKIKKYDD